MGVVAAVDVERQRLLAFVDAGNHLANVLVADDGQQRSENLFLHDARLVWHPVEQGRLHETVGLTDFATGQCSRAVRFGVVEQGLDAAGVARIDDVGQVGAAALIGQAVAIGLGELFAATPHPGLFHALVHEHMVGCDAGLPCVGEFGPHHIRCGQLKIGALVDDGRALAAQLQGDAGQVFGRGAHDVLADRGTAGEEDVIKRQFQQGLGHIGFAFKDGNLVFGEHLAHHLADQGRQMGRQLRRFQHSGVASSDRRNQWAQGQVHRVVERPDDQAAATGHVLNMAAHAQRQQGGPDAFGLHPFFEVANRVIGLDAHRQDLGQIHFALWFLEVGVGGAVPVVGVGNHSVTQPANLRDALLCGGAAQAQGRGRLPLENRLHV